jgi:hypothetical protein
LNIITSVFLLYMSEEDTLLLLDHITELLLPGYYNPPDLLGVQVDQVGDFLTFAECMRCGLHRGCFLTRSISPPPPPTSIHLLLCE